MFSFSLQFLRVLSFFFLPAARGRIQRALFDALRAPARAEPPDRLRRKIRSGAEDRSRTCITCFSDTRLDHLGYLSLVDDEGFEPPTSSM